LQSKFDEVKEKAAKAQALKQEREEALAAMPSYLEGLTSDQYLAFHEQALRILNRDKKKLSESSGILKVDIEHRYQPLLKLLKETRDIEDSLDAKIRQGIDSIFLSIYQVLWMLSSVDSQMKTLMKNLTTTLYPSMNSTIPYNYCFCLFITICSRVTNKNRRTT
jgi:hypothetical protein